MTSSKIPSPISSSLTRRIGIPIIVAIPTSTSFQGVESHVSFKSCSPLIPGLYTPSFIKVCFVPKAIIAAHFSIAALIWESWPKRG